jgi:hypothetical protein
MKDVSETFFATFTIRGLIRDISMVVWKKTARVILSIIVNAQKQNVKRHIVKKDLLTMNSNTFVTTFITSYYLN